MFGQQHDQNSNDHIPDQSIDAAMQDDQPSGAPAPPPSDQTWGHPGQPLADNTVVQPTVSSADNAAPANEQAHNDGNAAQPTNDLIDIKQQALSQLSPLVGHLDQTPEEKFRTTMMMIQASDDQSLVKVAYDAAQAITDEKVKAQALLDIVNEINYFTQNHQG